MFTETVASVDALRGCIRRPLAAVSLRRRVNPMVVTVLIVPMRPKLGFILRRACIRGNGKQQHSGHRNGTRNSKKSAHVLDNSRFCNYLNYHSVYTIVVITFRKNRRKGRTHEKARPKPGSLAPTRRMD
jgi:hypothetical protein